MIIATLCGYLLGSMSFSYLFGRMLKGIDIRQFGSGNAGATNTLRVLGKGPALAVLFLDVLKGVVAVWIGRWLGGGQLEFALLAGLGAIVGHNWPVYFSFRGGKGIATTIGVVATVCFLPAVVAGACAITILLVTRYVSVGSMVFALLLPPMLLLFDMPHTMVIWGLVLGGLAIYQHRTNIRKLVRREEHRIFSTRNRPEGPHR